MFLYRGEILIEVLHLIFSVVTFGLFQLVIPSLYNKQFTSRMFTSGWELSDAEENTQVARLKLGIEIKNYLYQLYFFGLDQLQKVLRIAPLKCLLLNANVKYQH